MDEIKVQMKNRSRLGRGLSAILGPEDEKKGEGFHLIDIEKIKPGKTQPRTHFDKEKIEELVHSIKQNGLLQPILLKKKGEDYLIIAGERRWRAASLAGLRQIPATIKEPEKGEESLWALVENIQREDLSSIEEARAFKKIMTEQNFSQEKLASLVGRARASVANTLRLLSLEKEVQDMLEKKMISFTQARELLTIKNRQKQIELAKKCASQDWTVKKLSTKSQNKKSVESPYWLEKNIKDLEKKFGLRIKHKQSGKGKGSLSFVFHSLEQLKTLLENLENKK